MDIEFEKLTQLQNLDSEIKQSTLFLENIPRLIEEIEGKIQAGSKAVAAAKEKLAQNQKTRRDLESEVKEIKAQISKFKRQLNEVKSNKEYTLLLKEIEDAQKSIDALEEKIISEMLAADDIEDEIKIAGQKQAREAENLRKEKEILIQKKREMEAKKDGFIREREALLPQIPKDLLNEYTNICDKRGGVAMSPVRDDFCAMCYVRVRPQMLNEIGDRSKIHLCENCGRILYWPPKSESPESE
ncbi:MAG TPA: hypothetical protein PLX50_01965 [Candidatus Aminicenantes bacterium]|nr:hypothetical protein [Candidatus Aminicenantes bacterium]